MTTRNEAHRTAVTCLIFSLALLGAVAPARCEAPTLVTITPDGVMDDWTRVLANPRNVTMDGQGWGISCLSSSDADCPIPGVDGNARDLRRLAWTYDSGNLYLFAERHSGATGWTPIFLHLDMDRSGRMLGGEDRIVLLLYDGGTGQVAVSVYDHGTVAPGGDLLVDGQGFADGWAVGGTLGAQLYQQPQQSWGAADGERFEAAVPWTALGRTGPAPFQFHAGAAESETAPSATVDNMGGPDRRVGDTGFHDYVLGPERSGALPPGGSLFLAHQVRNTGNLPDTYGLWGLSSESSRLGFWSDPDGDGDPADGVLLAVDSQGDGDFTDAQDSLFLDGDGDTLPEIGVIDAGAAGSFVLELTPKTGTKRATDMTEIHATSLSNGQERKILDQSAIGDLTLTPSYNLSVEPGLGLDLSHEVRNHLSFPLCVEFTVSSGLGWSWEIWSDPNGDGDASDGAMLADTCGGPDPDILVPAGESRTILARTGVPAGTALGALETCLLEAHSQAAGNPGASVTNLLTVAETLSLVPSYRLDAGEAKNASAGRNLFFRHTLEHNGPLPGRFYLSAGAAPGHTTTLFSDPDGDGLPTDGQIIPDGSLVGPVDAFGGRYPLLVCLHVAEGTPPGTTFSFDVTAEAEDNPFNAKTATDEGVVSFIAAYADPTHLLQENAYPRCGTVWALATGLVPDQADRYRFRWVEAAGPATIRALPFTSDANGEGTDALDVDPAFAEGDYSLILEIWDGAQWSELDRDEIRILDFWRFNIIATNRQVYTTGGDVLLVVTSFENTGPSVLRDTLLNYLITDPSGSLYLQPDGTFAPVEPGRWTWTAGPMDLVAGERAADAFAIWPVDFPVEGTYRLEARAVGGCAQVTDIVSTTFEVVTDSDGDGWGDATEAGIGTDPLDRDTDDDGILDPEDGDGDADGDTLPDALECDADGDTLPDSVEAGLDGLTLDADTDPGAGCFRADGDGGVTTTNRLAADSDGGGADDGEEDRDRDGVIEVLEKDPLDPTDDSCSWTPPPETTDLRIERGGSGLVLSWSDLSQIDPCVTYKVLSAADVVPDQITPFTEVGTGLTDPSFSHQGGGGIRFYISAGAGRIGGPGPLGHYTE